MKSFPEQGSPELEVVNFGPIARAEVDLRPLTVFIGPGNTGKSYLAILIYALHNYFNASASPDRRHFPGGYSMSRKAANDLAGWVREAFADRKRKSDPENIVLPAEIAELIRSGFSAQDTVIGNEIVRCFGIDETEALIRKRSRNGSRITLRSVSPDGRAAFESSLTIKKRATGFEMTIPEDLPLQINTKKSEYLAEELRFLTTEMPSGRYEERDYRVQEIAGFLTSLVLPQIVGPLRLPAFYLPADRAGVMHAHSMIVSALIRNAAMVGARPDTRTPMLSGVLADFLEQLIQFPAPKRKRHHYPGKAIEESILGGSVHIDRSGAADYPLFKYRPERWDKDMNLMNASSMVSELAPVVLYLRYKVRSNNLLIVEEPESHLHPAMQVEFTRQLAALVRSGIRMIVTTHSEWLLEELANLVQLSELPETKRKGIDGGGFALSPEQVGAWLFQPKNNPKGSVVKEVKLNDSGLYQSDFDDVSDALYNKWAEISGRIEENRCPEQ